MALTEARIRALKEVADGKVTHRMADSIQKQARFTVAGYWQKPRQEPYLWLRANGLITYAPSLRGAPVELTQLGKAALGQTRSRGHALISEGAAHDAEGQRVGSFMKTGGFGCAKCECGELSPELPSSNQRKDWHRDHKESIRGDSDGR